MTMTRAGNQAPQLACANLIAAFAHHVDHREFEKAVALFTEDGSFIRPDLEARGHAEIARIWEARPPSVVTKHLCAATFFGETGPQVATAVTPFTLYTVEWDGDGLPKFDQPTGIGEFHDRFVATTSGWRIAERRGLPIMLRR